MDEEWVLALLMVHPLDQRLARDLGYLKNSEVKFVKGNPFIHKSNFHGTGEYSICTIKFEKPTNIKFDIVI